MSFGPDGTWNPLFLDEDKFGKKLETERNRTAWIASGNVPFSNTWDFMIYYVVICGTLLLGNLKRYSSDPFISQALKWSVIQWGELLSAAFLASLPFHLSFENVMVRNWNRKNTYCFLPVLCIMGIPAFGLCTICYWNSEKIRTFPDKKIRSF